MVDLFKVMERECLHSEHAAQCFISAKRKARKADKANRALEQSENDMPRCERFNYTSESITGTKT